MDREIWNARLEAVRRSVEGFCVLARVLRDDMRKAVSGAHPDDSWIYGARSFAEHMDSEALRLRGSINSAQTDEEYLSAGHPFL